MLNKRIPGDDDELGTLRAPIEAIRAQAPDDAQWAAARGRLLSHSSRPPDQQTPVPRS